MKKIKSLIYTLLTGIILTATLVATTFSSEAATNIAKYAWRDDGGNIIFRTIDHKSTNPYKYQTLGYTITRCVLGTQDPIESEYFSYRCNDPYFNEAGIGGGYITTDFVLSETEFLSNVASVNTGWLEDIESGQTCWIRIDAIMCVVDSTQPNIPMYSGAMRSTNNQDYWANPVHDHPGVWDKFTQDNLVNNTYGWADRKQIYNHFNIYVCYNGGEEAPKEIIPVEETISHIEMEPEYYTWNSNDVGGQSGRTYNNNRVGEYDAALGIPSGETITNGVGADNWFGQYSYGKHKMTKEYLLNYPLKCQTYGVIGSHWEDKNGDGYRDDDEMVDDWGQR